MTLAEKALYAIAALGISLILILVGAYWWSGTVPSRPKTVAANAVFLWAPHVGLPAPRRGSWLACWRVIEGSDRCRLSAIDGKTEYEGEFVPYGRKPPLPTDQMSINAEKTREQKLWVGEALVPLVYLYNGDVLIPADEYEEGSRMLNRSKSST
jgi:hypothetical protein